MRADEVKPSLPREVVLAEAPDQDGRAFVVPRIIE
jgi:Asp-tRNA(Asn)/Glu-tRNA(Gln) amidotransferase C subunit